MVFNIIIFLEFSFYLYYGIVTLNASILDNINRTGKKIKSVRSLVRSPEKHSFTFPKVVPSNRAELWPLEQDSNTETDTGELTSNRCRDVSAGSLNIETDEGRKPTVTSPFSAHSIRRETLKSSMLGSSSSVETLIYPYCSEMMTEVKVCALP